MRLLFGFSAFLLSTVAALAEVRTEWVWVRVSDGRPTRVPPELVALAAGAPKV